MSHSRRVFLGSAVAAGVGSVAAFSLTESTTIAQTAGTDPVTRELQRQFRAAMKGLREGKGEAARQFASLLRLQAVHLGAKGADAHLRSEIATAVREKGRAWVLSRPVNHAEMERMAKDLGAPPGFHDAMGSGLSAGREVALDTLLKEGLTPSLIRAADLLESLSPMLDKNKMRVLETAYQLGGPPGSASCSDICGFSDALNDYMTIVCGFAGAFPNPLSAELCAAAFGAWMGAWAVCMACRLFGG